MLDFKSIFNHYMCLNKQVGKCVIIMILIDKKIWKDFKSDVICVIPPVS